MVEMDIRRRRAPTITIDTSPGSEYDGSQCSGTPVQKEDDTMVRGNFLMVPSPRDKLDVDATGGSLQMPLHPVSLTRDSALELNPLRCGPNGEADFEIENNPFAFSPGQLNKFLNPKSLSIFYAYRSLENLEKGFRTSAETSLSIQGAVLHKDIAIESKTSEQGTCIPAQNPNNVTQKSYLDDASSHLAERAQNQSLDNKTPMSKSLRPALDDRTLAWLAAALVAAPIWGIFTTTYNDLESAWVEGTAIFVAMSFVMAADTLNDYQKERLFTKFNDGESERTARTAHSEKMIEASAPGPTMRGNMPLLPDPVGKLTMRQAPRTFKVDTMPGIDAPTLSGSTTRDDVNEMPVPNVGPISSYEKTTTKVPAQALHLIWQALKTTQINALLVFFPPSIIASFLGWPPVLHFVINFIAIIPLAYHLSMITDLLIATLGDIVELVVDVVALQCKRVGVIQVLVFGSVLPILLRVPLHDGLSPIQIAGGNTPWLDYNVFWKETTPQRIALYILLAVSIGALTVCLVTIRTDDNHSTQPDSIHTEVVCLCSQYTTCGCDDENTSIVETLLEMYNESLGNIEYDKGKNSKYMSWKAKRTKSDSGSLMCYVSHLREFTVPSSVRLATYIRSFSLRKIEKISWSLVCATIFSSLPTRAVASPTGPRNEQSSVPSTFWVIVEQFFTTIAKCGIGAILAAVMVILFCSIINVGARKLLTEREKTIHRVQHHGIASLLAAGVFMYLLKREQHDRDKDTDDTIAFSGVTVFWVASHVLFWWEHFQLHAHLDNWHRMMPWFLGALGVVWALLDTAEQATARVACVFWLPILGWPYLVLVLTKLTNFHRHVFSFSQSNFEHRSGLIA